MNYAINSFIRFIFAAIMTVALFAIMNALITNDEINIPEVDYPTIPAFTWVEPPASPHELWEVDPVVQPTTQPDKIVDHSDVPTRGFNNGERYIPPPTVDPTTGPTYTSPDPIPVYVPQPRYPRRAVTKGISGYAVVSVTITETGAVRDPLIVEEYPDGYSFGSAAEKAAAKLKYNPRVIDGQPQEVKDVLYKFSFKIEE